jgi:hypothetical protein
VYIRSSIRAPQILVRVMAMLVLVVPILGIVGAIIDFASAPEGRSFANTLADDGVLIYLFGLGPALVTSLAHTQVTHAARLAQKSLPRLRATLYGSVIGTVAGFGLGLLGFVVEAGLNSTFVLFAIGWGALGGLIYGLLVGPTPLGPERAT